MRMYEDKPMHYDNWDIDCYYTEKFWDVTDVQRMEWTERGPVRATLEIERKVSRSVICQKIHLRRVPAHRLRDDGRLERAPAPPESPLPDGRTHGRSNI